MKKGTQILRCPLCGVHTGTKVPFAMTRFGIMVYDYYFKDNSHSPKYESPKEDFPMGYWCKKCWDMVSIVPNIDIPS